MSFGWSPQPRNPSIVFKKNDKIHLFFKSDKKRRGINYTRADKNPQLFNLIFDSNLNKKEVIHESINFYAYPSLIIDNEYIIALTREYRKKNKGLVKIIPE